ncbi:hypothetical protein AVEN_221064-1 [Araneus ventricosus]|uniref:Uncharacterized protein n=1 Tax=Araneus ventricosus TaxID=182803 RepID=A0A4Y2S435_ARAVE|nr:hypothetical protein AVEN_221064-1 [Araneus ventricosus]
MSQTPQGTFILQILPTYACFAAYFHLLDSNRGISMKVVAALFASSERKLEISTCWPCGDPLDGWYTWSPVYSIGSVLVTAGLLKGSKRRGHPWTYVMGVFPPPLGMTPKRIGSAHQGESGSDPQKERLARVRPQKELFFVPDPLLKPP